MPNSSPVVFSVSATASTRQTNVAVGRYCVNERMWTFPARPAPIKQIRILASLYFVRCPEGIAQRLLPTHVTAGKLFITCCHLRVRTYRLALPRRRLNSRLRQIREHANSPA